MLVVSLDDERQSGESWRCWFCVWGPRAISGQVVMDWHTVTRWEHWHSDRADAVRCALDQFEGHRFEIPPTLQRLVDSDLAAQRRALARQRARRQLLEGPGWRRTRAEVLFECATCRVCGAPATQVDHIVPLYMGGTSDRDNLQALCQACHLAKTTAERTRRPTTLPESFTHRRAAARGVEKAE